MGDVIDLVVSVDGASKKGAAFCLLHPIPRTGGIVPNIVAREKWSTSRAMRDGGLSASAAAANDVRLAVERYIAGCELPVRVIVRTEGQWAPRGKKMTPQSMIGPAMSAGHFHPLFALGTAPGWIEIPQPAEWRQHYGIPNNAPRDEAKMMALRVAGMLAPGMNLTVDEAEALLIGMLAPSQFTNAGRAR